jgi:hypothetical protein
MQELNFVVVEANSVSELEKKVNDRMAFGYAITNTQIVLDKTAQGQITFFQTMIKTLK